ncbi:hypothetical protein ACE1SV_18680 [Streptomyces sennicomposti]
MPTVTVRRHAVPDSQGVSGGGPRPPPGTAGGRDPGEVPREGPALLGGAADVLSGKPPNYAVRGAQWPMPV